MILPMMLAMILPTNLLLDSAFCSRLGLMLLHSFWQVALLALVAWGVDRFCLKRSVECSYWVYVAALVLALVAMPATFGLLGSRGEWVTSRAAEAVSPGDASALNSFSLQAAPSDVVGSQTNMLAAFPASTETLPAQVLAPTVWQRAAPWLVVAYGLGVVLMLVRLVRAWVSSNRLGSRAEKIVDGPLVETLRSLARRWSMRVVPVLAETQEMLLPKVVGLARPMILLPTAAIAGLSPDELEMILAHELAHVRRHDMWVNLLQRLAEVVLFFNPALWYLSRRISTLREYCCDEMTCELMANAASKTGSRTASKNDPEPQLRYATALLHVAELAQPNTVAPSDLAALAATGRSPSELRRRVARLFGEPMREPVRVTRGGFFTLVAMALLIAGGPAIWRTEAQTAGDSSEVATATNEFPFDGKVEVLAIGTHGENPQRWWDANGTPRQRVPFHLQGGTVAASDDSMCRELVFRVPELPKDATVIYKLPAIGPSANGEVVLNGQESPAGYYSQIFSVGSDIKTLDLRVGIASGAWRTVADWAPSGQVALGLADGNSLAVAETFVGKRGTSVVVSHSFRKSNFRVRAIDTTGKAHKSTRSSENSAGSVASLSTWSFGDLALEKIKRFEFQVREYEWVEVKGLPLEQRADGPEVDQSVTAEEPRTPQLQVRRITTAVEAQELEDQLLAKPKDLSLRASLLRYYFGKQRRSTTAGEARKKHIKWIIQNRPEAKVAGNSDAHLYPILDGKAYFEAKELWLLQVEAHNKNAAILGNAAAFLQLHDRGIAEGLLKKSQYLEPKNPIWPTRLGRLYSLGVLRKSEEGKRELAAKSLVQRERALQLTTDGKHQFYLLSDLALAAFEAGERKKAEEYAMRLLKAASQHKRDWNYGNAIHHGNQILGRIALAEGDLEKAKACLLESGKTPGSPQLNSFGPSMILAKELLEQGESEVAIEYFQLCGIFWKSGAARLKKWTVLVQGGEMPEFSRFLAR